MINILCFGDSNTFGYMPGGVGRFDENTRWTMVLQKRLGKGYNVIEEGLCGRTTIFEDPIREGMCGINDIESAVTAHNPIDIIIIMLGTNDCKVAYKSDEKAITCGLNQLIDKAKNVASKDMKIIIAAPILLEKGVGDEGFDKEFDETSELISESLAVEYEKLAANKDYYFLDMSKVSVASEIDRVHLDEIGHKAVADAFYSKIISI